MRWLELSVTTDVEAVEAVSEILGRISQGTAVHPTSLFFADCYQLFHYVAQAFSSENNSNRKIMA